MSDECLAMEWVQQWGHHATCSLPRDHEGPHADPEGWEW